MHFVVAFSSWDLVAGMKPMSVLLYMGLGIAWQGVRLHKLEPFVAPLFLWRSEAYVSYSRMVRLTSYMMKYDL